MKGKKDFMAIKLDMSKAYDRVKLRYLGVVMRRMGFAPQWVQLIMMCVTSVRYSVMVNGTPCGLIQLQRGLRQGDLISSYLFLLGVEGLSTMLSQATEEGNLSSVPTSKRGPCISHLFFVNDNLLFCQTNLSQWG
jgi:hypothetical protein